MYLYYLQADGNYIYYLKENISIELIKYKKNYIIVIKLFIIYTQVYGIYYLKYHIPRFKNLYKGRTINAY